MGSQALWLKDSVSALWGERPWREDSSDPCPLSLLEVKDSNAGNSLSFHSPALRVENRKQSNYHLSAGAQDWLTDNQDF